MITVAVELHVLGDQQKLPGRHQLRYGHALIYVFFYFCSEHFNLTAKQYYDMVYTAPV